MRAYAFYFATQTRIRSRAGYCMLPKLLKKHARQNVQGPKYRKEHVAVFDFICTNKKKH